MGAIHGTANTSYSRMIILDQHYREWVRSQITTREPEGENASCY
jgi:hypothetical protein